jgi:hypothetical protein
LVELIFTAYDIQTYHREALPALKAAIYRANLAPARDVLALHDDTLYDEYELSQVLVDADYNWVFTVAAGDPEGMDPEGALVGLAYPLILLYHQPDVFRMTLGGPELDKILPFGEYLNRPAPQDSDAFISESGLKIEPGFREGLRLMWEIVGYLTPDDVCALQIFCATTGRERALKRSEGAARVVSRLAESLKAVTDRGLGLVIERE